MEKGRSAFDAAIESSAELWMPLLTASLTTSAAFLPIYLAESSVGEFTSSLFKVVTITLLSSWVIALTVVPVLCVLFLRVGKKETTTVSAIEQGYAQYVTTYRTLAPNLQWWKENRPTVWQQYAKESKVNKFTWI